MYQYQHSHLQQSQQTSFMSKYIITNNEGVDFMIMSYPSYVLVEAIKAITTYNYYYQRNSKIARIKLM